MQSIKFYKKYDTHFAKLGDVEYKGYTIGELPPSFGVKFKDDEGKLGKYEWFNYKGLTYVEKTELPW